MKYPVSTDILYYICCHNSNVFSVFSSKSQTKMLNKVRTRTLNALWSDSLCILVQRAILHAQLHCGFRIGSGSWSRTFRKHQGPSPEGMAFCQARRMLFFCKKPASFLEGRDYENNTVLFLVVLKFICSFSTPLLRQVSQVPAGGCIMSSAAQFLMNTKKVAATENVSQVEELLKNKIASRSCPVDPDCEMTLAM